jgi:hypothetical protein
MCNIKDAERYEKLAQLCVRDKDFKEAKMNYLEAASIYVMNAELLKQEILLKKANFCYKKSKEVMGEKWDRVLDKKELAKRTLEECAMNKV